MKRALSLLTFTLVCGLAISRVGVLIAQESPRDVSKDPPAGSEEAGGEDLPPPLTEYMGRRIAPTMHYSGAAWLTRDVREAEENAQKMLDALQVKPGQTVCDLGCGNGYHTLRLAELVGREGKVLAVDIQKEMLDMLAERAKRKGFENIERIHGTLVDPKLPERKVDLVLLVDVYHEFSHPAHMLRAIRRSLSDKGRVVLVEFRAEDPDVPILPLHKMTREQVERELTANGFELVEAFDELPWQHMLFFEKLELP
jgi:SAM-dependent methyltransferase